MGRSGPRRRRGRRPAGGWLVGASDTGLSGGGGRWGVVARVGVEAGGLAGGWLVRTGDAWGLSGGGGRWGVVARVGVEAGGLAVDGWYVPVAHGSVWTGPWLGRSGPRRRRAGGLAGGWLVRTGGAWGL